MNNVQLKVLGKSLGVDGEYLDAIIYAKDAKKIKAILIGVDPFPKNPIGIPFCKTTWEALGMHTGYRVFSSLLGMSNLIALSGNPKEAAISLAEKEGIIFLNSSYQLLRNLKGPAKEHAKSEGFKFNKIFIESNSTISFIICMGKGYNFTQKYMSANSPKMIKVYHPSAYPFSRNNNLWKDYWNKGSLKKLLKVNIKIK